MILRLSEYNIKNLIEELEYVEESIDVASQNVVKKLVNVGYGKAVELNAIAPQSGVEKSIVTKSISKSESSGTIALEGESAVYDEFGTGEEGASDGHPLKGNYGLNPYNSGPVVSKNINSNGRHYWFYTPMSGYPYFKNSGYTEGIPSGKQMYNTTNYLLSVKRAIINEELNGAIRTLK